MMPFNQSVMLAQACNYDDIVSTFAQEIARGDDVFEGMCSIAEMATDLDTALRFLIGDMGLLLRQTARYGDAAIPEYAKRAKRAVSTVYSYIDCSIFYSIENRRRWMSEPTLGWGHLKAAMRLKDHELVDSTLNTAADECWSVDKTLIEVRKLMGESVDPPPLLSIAVTLTYERGRWTITGLDELDTTKLHMGTLRVTS